MAPEQLEGAEADARSDIWAFGCVLYEMLTGRRPFDGKTQATLISAVIASEPATMTSLQPLAAPALEYTVRTCLAKNPDDRFQNAHDLLLQLRWMVSPGSQAGAPTAVVARRRWKTRAGLVAAAAAATAVTAAVTWWLMKAPQGSGPPVIRADVVLPGGVAYNMAVTKNMALSPDGARLVFAGLADDDSRLMVRELHGTNVTPLVGTELAVMPFFSPDGQWIGFTSGAKLRKVPIAGGTPVIICDAPAVFGAVWAPDDTIIFANVATRGLMRVSAGSGTPTPLTTPGNGELDHRWPALLPDGRSVVYAASTSGSWSEAAIVVQPLDGGARTVVLHGGTSPQTFANGQLAFARAGSLYVAAIDAVTGATAGTPRPAVEGIAFNDADGRAHYTVSAAGTLVYLAGLDRPAQRTLAWVDRDGRTQSLPVQPRPFEHPRLSPNGRYVALTIRASNPDVWLLDLTRNTLSRFTFDPAEDESPIWTPDSRFITFSTARAGKDRQTLSKAVDGSGEEEELFTSPRHQHLGAWTRDGATLITEEVDVNWRIYAGAREPRTWTPVTPAGFAAQAVQISPDGRWIAYSSNEGGPQEIYVQAFPGPGGKSQVSSGGGTEPRWSPKGDELFYRNGDRMMAVKVQLGATFAADTPHPLFEGHFTRMGWGQANYDVSLDGRRFIMVQGTDPPLPTAFKLVANWYEELKSSTPGK